MRALRRIPLLLAAVLLLAGAAVQAQDARRTERELQKIRRELQSVATERRKLEGERGAASRQLRSADEQVGASDRALRQNSLRADDSRLGLGLIGGIGLNGSARSGQAGLLLGLMQCGQVLSLRHAVSGIG